MQYNEIIENLRNALMKLLSLRVIVTSPSRKVADLPLLYLIVAALMAVKVAVVIVLVGFLAGYRARLEKA
jgi:ABC-type long-subunit fatty acid transport system fused permease/ATPase subunit